MSTEEEQNEAYRATAVENAYDILFERFCKIDKLYEFEKATLKEKQKILKDLAEEII